MVAMPGRRDLACLKDSALLVVRITPYKCLPRLLIKCRSH